MNLTLPRRYQLFTVFGLVFLTLSFFTRIAFYVWSFENIDFSIVHLFGIFLTGLIFDIGTISFFLLPYSFYLLVLPNKLNGSLFDKIVTHFAFFVGLLIFIFSFFAEFTFWEEFNSRFNFIAVEYLIYSHEVFQNINESYPLPLLIPAILLVVVVFIYFFHQKKVFKTTFRATTSIKQKLTATILSLVVSLIFILFITNKNAEWSNNRYENELCKSGIYSFCAAFRSNEI